MDRIIAAHWRLRPLGRVEAGIFVRQLSRGLASRYSLLLGGAHHLLDSLLLTLAAPPFILTCGHPHKAAFRTLSVRGQSAKKPVKYASACPASHTSSCLELSGMTAT